MIRDDFARFLWSQPLLYRAFNTLRFRVDAFDRGFDILFDGFPRSGNTYGAHMLVATQKKRRLKVITHQHKPSLFFRAAIANKPACLTLRPPIEAITSWIIYSNLSIESIVNYYIFFYQVLLPHRSKFLVLPFSLITSDFTQVIRLINHRFGMDLEQPPDLEACRREVFAQIDDDWRNKSGVVDTLRVARPNPVREERKKAVSEELLSPRYAGLLRRCQELHQTYEYEYLCHLPQELPQLTRVTPYVQVAAASGLKISVITPSYKQLPWLKLAAASVADQKGVVVEHIIQDAQTGSELESWVKSHTKAELHVECDTGMYDAINRGFARATGDIVCWLNCDEQYLEGTLARVARYFEMHPEIDVLFGDAFLVGNTGELLSYRRTIAPTLGHIQASHLNVLSCATFVRRSVLDCGYHLDDSWKAIADAVWIAAMLKARIPTAVLNEPLSAFTITDSNLGQTSLAKSELQRWREHTSSNVPLLRLGHIAWHRIKKFLQGAYWPRSGAVRLYTQASPEKRVLRESHSLGYRWQARPVQASPVLTGKEPQKS